MDVDETQEELPQRPDSESQMELELEPGTPMHSRHRVRMKPLRNC